MDRNQIYEIIECLPRERTIFRYFKGRYAIMLLQDIIGNGAKISYIRNSSFSGLLDKPELKPVLALAGQGIVTPSMLDAVWPGDTYHFLLTLGAWGRNCHRWDQTSRRGYNLVLQLNFSNLHDNVYKKMVKPVEEQMLNGSGHPVLHAEARPYFRETLAWSRIDLDFETDTALVEEIQCDWLRKAKYLLKHAKRRKDGEYKSISWHDSAGNVDDVVNYCEELLKPYEAVWDEAMLSATIDFIRHEIGIKNIYYHSEKTGFKVKNIRYTQPPRSLYSKLPRKFCFSLTKEAPEFLFGDKYFRRSYRKVENPQWYKLVL